VAAGLLSVLNFLAATTPLLVAIDDFQWLDEPTWPYPGVRDEAVPRSGCGAAVRLRC
jgi:hypothetical protein